MAQKIKIDDEDPCEVYADIMDLPRPGSRRHTPMSLNDRAAQFSSFAALAGFEDMIDEEARLVDARIELSEEETEQISRQLALADQAARDGKKPRLSLVYFVPDSQKSGGKYEWITEEVKNVDPVRQTVVLRRQATESGSWLEIPIGDILAIQDETKDES